ncbi:hypothetical protein VDBG_06065 [Verticillium alfalfae VaMs.102]|uniref:Uncharacterized protein n=1 Tax=Verticillium alfalfae (strain VaMs.102 / ATCC MYA-4576 / FGSC 10136) TaxID=526221 RepID=C9SME1_VERA1|nr:hypothetical protein VDBG_06065 [Verticillium alfalfae VaMs.102]EEY19956.1 hypothetical protein VDBG_06065 [Verticillium alfalfae VaMs.102]
MSGKLCFVKMTVFQVYLLSLAVPQLRFHDKP